MGHLTSEKTQLKIQQTGVIYSIPMIQRKEVRPGEESHDFTVTGIYKFQLAPMPSGPDLHPFIDKKLKITGCFYGAFNHHQVTDVVLATYTAEEVKK